MFKKVSVLFALIAAVTFFAAPQQAAAAAGDVTVDIHGPAVDHDGVYAGSAFQVDVFVDDISDPDGLAGGSFELDYDENFLAVHDPDPNTQEVDDPQLGQALTDNGCSFDFSDDGSVLTFGFACGSALDISTVTDVVIATVIFEQPTPPGSDQSAAFSINNLQLNDGTVTAGEPDPQLIAGLSSIPGSANIYTGTCGDQNDDGNIDTRDATIDAFYAVSQSFVPTEKQLVMSDVAPNGDIDAGDVIATLQHIVGKFTITQCGPADPLAAP